MGVGAQLRHAWNAFTQDQQDRQVRARDQVSPWYGPTTTSLSSATTRLKRINDKTILTAIYVRMAVDAAGVDFKHVRLDEDGLYQEVIQSYLNECLSVEANVDQAKTAFFLDVFMSLFDNGYMGLVPVDTTLNPDVGGGWDIKTLRVGEILSFKPQHVVVSVWNEAAGIRQELVLPKSVVAVVYNPFYPVMNDGSSVLQRLARKLAILDTVDEASASGKLDILIQLPYTVRGETKRKQAENRHKDLEVQLKGSQLGIGYIDATEKVVQLNRPAENNLQSQIEYLVNLLYGQLGITPEIMNGTASEAIMLNYMNRTIAPLTNAVKEAMHRTFLTKTARSQKQAIQTFWDSWQFIPLTTLAPLINALSRNEVVTANEIRAKIGFKPHSDPKANELINSNMPGGNQVIDSNAPPGDPNAPPVDSNASPDGVDPAAAEQGAQDQAAIDEMNSLLDGAFTTLGVNPNAA
jgi:hypothetical protein